MKRENNIEKVLSLPPIGEIQWGLDYLITEGKLIKISGWAAFKGQDDDNSDISLIFKKDGDIFLSSANPSFART